MQRKFLQPTKGQVVPYERPIAYVLGKPVRERRQSIPVVIIAIIAVIAMIVGISSSSEAKTTNNTVEVATDTVNDVDFDFPEEIKLADGKGTTLKSIVDISAYYNELEDLLEKNYEGTDVVSLKLYSYVTNNSSIQYLVWFSSDSDDYKLDQFSSSTITEFIRGNVEVVECTNFVSGYSGGAFIIQES